MEYEDIQDEIDQVSFGSESWGSEELKLLFVFLGILAVTFGYMCYRNYVLISSGEMQRIIRKSKKNKKNRERWDVDEI